MDKSITISEKMRLVRKNCGFNQTEFAIILGVKQSYLSDLESGKRELTTKVVESLAQKFIISANWLLLNIGEMYIDDVITNIDNQCSLLEENKDFLDNYMWGTLSSYDKRQICFYDYYSEKVVIEIRSRTEQRLKNIYESNRRLIDMFHLFVPSEKRFSPLPDFESYVKRVYDEFDDNIMDVGGLENVKLTEILKILYLKEDKFHWISNLTIKTDYMEMHKKMIMFKMAGDFPSEQ